MEIIINNRLELSNIPNKLYQGVCSRLTLDNPKWIENDKMGRWNGGTPKHLRFYEKTASGLILPRGFTRQLISMASRYNVSCQVEDQRRSLPETDLIFHGKLKPFQEKAVSDILSREFGTLSAATGSDKRTGKNLWDNGKIEASFCNYKLAQTQFG